MELRRITCRRIVELSEAGSYVRVLNIRIFLQLQCKSVSKWFRDVYNNCSEDKAHLGLKLVFDHFDVFLFDHHTVLVNCSMCACVHMSPLQIIFNRHIVKLTVTNDKLAGTIPHGIQMQQDLLCGGVAVWVWSARAGGPEGRAGAAYQVTRTPEVILTL